MLQKGDYELSEILASIRFGDCRAGEALDELDATVFAHVTFMAKNNDPHCINVASELFFAELNINGDSLVNTCVNMTEAGLASYEAETKCKACPLRCNMDHPNGRYFAGISEGIFADAQDINGSWGAKIELQEKKVSSKSARC